jgi:hypothetical protein
MLTFEDCLGLCELTEDEVDAIVEHEHLPELLALELGNYLIHTASGERRVSRMILEDIEEARQRGDLKHAAKLKLVLAHFVETHPNASAA